MTQLEIFNLIQQPIICEVFKDLTQNKEFIMYEFRRQPVYHQ